MTTNDTWDCWTLSEGDIRGIAERKGLLVAEKDFDSIAASVKTGIAWALDDIWEEIVITAINNVEENDCINEPPKMPVINDNNITEEQQKHDAE